MQRRRRQLHFQILASAHRCSVHVGARAGVAHYGCIACSRDERRVSKLAVLHCAAKAATGAAKMAAHVAQQLSSASLEDA